MNPPRTPAAAELAPNGLPPLPQPARGVVPLDTRRTRNGGGRRWGRRARRDALEEALAQAPIAKAVVAPDGRLLDGNAALCELTGYTADELSQATLDLLVHPDDRAAHREQLEHMLANGTRTAEAERRLLTRQGRVVWALLSVRIVDHGASEPALAVVQIQDVSDRKLAEMAVRRSENRYRTLAASLPDATVLVYDRDLCFVLCEGRGLEAAGWDRVALEGRLLREVVPRESYELLAPHYLAALDGERRSFELGSPNGDRVYAVEIVPLRADYGEITGGMVVSRDITERKRDQNELRAAHEALERHAAELERSNADLEHFASVASHDLSEPLRVISGFASMLERRHADQLDDEGRDFLAQIAGAAGEMRTLIQVVLEYARAGRGERVLEPVDCGALWEDVEVRFHEALERSGARVTADPLPTVTGDRTQLGQVFQNLLGNAMKFSGGPPRIHVSASREQGAWRFSVSDEGIGIAPESRARVFEMLGRLHTREEYGGSGLGLAICKRIVERHGGRIWVESRLGEGSTFHFTVADAQEAER